MYEQNRSFLGIENLEQFKLATLLNWQAENFFCVTKNMIDLKSKCVLLLLEVGSNQWDQVVV